MEICRKPSYCDKSCKFLAGFPSNEPIKRWIVRYVFSTFWFESCFLHFLWSLGFGLFCSVFLRETNSTNRNLLGTTTSRRRIVPSPGSFAVVSPFSSCIWVTSPQASACGKHQEKWWRKRGASEKRGWWWSSSMDVVLLKNTCRWCSNWYRTCTYMNYNYIVIVIVYVYIYIIYRIYLLV